MDEALVIFELLSRYSEDDTLEVTHKAEEIALWNALAALEKILAEPISADYKTILANARDRLAG